MEFIYIIIYLIIVVIACFFGLRYAYKKQRERDELYFQKLTGSIYEALIQYEEKRYDNEMTFRYYDMQRKDHKYE